jgi:predicted nucleic acid-binding protein
MAHRRTYLLDTSVLHRARDDAVRAQLDPLSRSDVLASCAIVDLEVLYSARSFRHYERTGLELAGLLHTPVDARVFDRARDVQHELARTGHHRVPVPDLVIAAAAELAGHVVLHYDAHFEQIARVSGQPHKWVVERGAI